MKRELNKQEKKESKHALDVQHGSHPTDSRLEGCRERKSS
jgi:hypothetical protein